jgi:hypothetical protein
MSWCVQSVERENDARRRAPHLGRHARAVHFDSPCLKGNPTGFNASFIFDGQIGAMIPLHQAKVRPRRTPCIPDLPELVC